MTRREFSGKRDLTVSGWIRENLPDSSTGFLVSDLDFILYNYKTKRIMLLEVKQHGKEMATWQNNLFKNLALWISKGIDKDWNFLGFHSIKFENTDFKDGKCYYDHQEITEEELKHLLNF